MWFVVSELGLAEQSSWEELLGALGRGAESRGSGMEELVLPCGVWQCHGRGLGSPWPEGSRLGSPGAVWSQEMQNNPSPPSCVQSKRESKAAENPGFPFLFGREGCGKHRGGDRQVKWAQLHLFLTPLHPQPPGGTGPHNPPQLFIYL